MNQYSIIELMENSFKKNRDKIAIIDDSQQYTYGEFEEIVNIVANNIYSNNLQKKKIAEKCQKNKLSAYRIIKNNAQFLKVIFVKNGELMQNALTSIDNHE